MPAGHYGFYTYAYRTCWLLCPCLHVYTALAHMPAGHYSSYTHVCRSLRPAQDAASVLQRYKQENPTSKLGMQDAHPERQAHADDGKQQQGICRNCSCFLTRLRADSGGERDVCMWWRLRLYASSKYQGWNFWLMLLAMHCAYSSLAAALLCSYRVTQKDNGTPTVYASMV